VLHTEEIWVKKKKKKRKKEKEKEKEKRKRKRKREKVRKLQFIKYILFVKNNLITKYLVIK
jgi:hypothetical protein